MAETIDLKSLIKNGVHFGHQTSKWNPEMAPFIWGSKNGIHLIDVSKTAYQLQKAAKFLESIAAQGKTIVWVGTKKPAQSIIEKIGKELNQPHIAYRWVGGTFTNWQQVLKALKNLLNYEDIIAKSSDFHYTKKELSLFQKRIDRLNKIVGGIRNLKWPIGAVVVIDVKKEHVVIKEAQAKGIPVVALVDTNGSLLGVEYPIPGNDDVPRSIELIANFLAEAVKKGQAVAAERPQEEISVETVEVERIPGFEEEEEAKDNKKRRQPSRPKKATKPKAEIQDKPKIKAKNKQTEEAELE